MKICFKCNKNKDILQFRGNRNTCRDCENIYSQEHYRRTNRRWRRHGLSDNEFKGLWDKNQGCCHRCNKILGEFWCIDHDHNHCSDKFGCKICVRGILCKSCNTFLKGLEDSVAANTLESDILYITHLRPF